MDLNGELSAPERVVLSVDTSREDVAVRQASLAREAGLRIIKAGLQQGTAEDLGWDFASYNADGAGVEWIADLKGHDIPTTLAAAVSNLCTLPHPPIGITVHTATGIDALKAAQTVAEEASVTLFGVTMLSSIDDDELKDDLGWMLGELEIEYPLHDVLDARGLWVGMLARKAKVAGLGGLVVTGNDMSNLLATQVSLRRTKTLFVGTRSEGYETHDQKHPIWPLQAIMMGATLLETGRQVTASADPSGALAAIIDEVDDGLQERSKLKEAFDQLDRGE